MNRSLKPVLFVLMGAFTLTPLRAEPIAETSKNPQADVLYSQRTENTGAPQALTLYEQTIAANPASEEVLWKAARACHWIADHAPTNSEKIMMYERGIKYAQKAVTLKPQSPEAHFWLGALYGSYGEVKGVLKSLSLVKPIRAEMETINRLNEQFQGGAGYRVLGIVDYKVPGFAGGNKKRALDELTKALSIAPNQPFNLFYMADYYAVIGNRTKASDYLNRLLTMQISSDVDNPDLLSVQAKGKKLAAKLQ